VPSDGDTAGGTREVDGAEDLGECPECGEETRVHGPLAICEEYCPECGKVRFGHNAVIYRAGELGPHDDEEEEDDDRVTVENSEPSALGEFA